MIVTARRLPDKFICQADTKPRWYRPKGGKCPFKAAWVTATGKLLCNLHAKVGVFDNAPAASPINQRPGIVK